MCRLQEDDILHRENDVFLKLPDTFIRHISKGISTLSHCHEQLSGRGVATSTANACNQARYINEAMTVTTHSVANLMYKNFISVSKNSK